jgi:tRNA(Ile)-lysidine synthase
VELLNKFLENIKRNDLFTEKDKLLLAVSGGVDSVVLCELCKQAGYDFDIVHCNFQLRDEESERDEQFVKELGKKYGAEVWVKKFLTAIHAEGSKISIQEAARDLRYGWFIQKAAAMEHESGKKVSVLTAHHADDNVETVLMNFFRGTGLHGMTGIPKSYYSVRRPLLPFSKEELIAFAKENKLDWVEDSSNESSKYTRNFFRNEIIPALAKVYPQVKENLQDNINRFNEIEKLYKFSVGEIIKKIGKKKGNELYVPVKQLMAFNNRALIYEIINAYGFSEKQIDEVIKLAGSESGKYIVSAPGSYRIIKHRHWFIITPVFAGNAENIIVEEGMNSLQCAMGNLQLAQIPVKDCQLPTANSVALFDSDTIEYPLLLRKWKQGDYFYPLGMKKKKKLSRFFIDNKFSLSQKENAWVIESDKRIIWVVGHRIDERCKVTEKTRKVLRISLCES